jgi:hypothetical protein
LTGAIGRRHSQRGRPLGHDSSRGVQLHRRRRGGCSVSPASIR